MDKLNNDIIAIGLAILAFIISIPKILSFFAKDKIDSVKKINDLEEKTMRQWVEAKFIELKNLVEKLELKTTFDFKQEIRNMEKRLEEKIEEKMNMITTHIEHKVLNKINEKNMESQLLFDRLEKSDRIIEQGSSMIKQLGNLLHSEQIPRPDYSPKK